MSTPRCKPGDLAIIVRANGNKEVIGKVVTVLHAAPLGEFFLPNGRRHCSLQDGMGFWWVCEFQQPVSAPTEAGFWTKTTFAPVPDDMLRPIRDPGADAVDEMVLRVRVPTADEVNA